MSTPQPDLTRGKYRLPGPWLSLTLAAIWVLMAIGVLIADRPIWAVIALLMGLINLGVWRTRRRLVTAQRRDPSA